MFCLQNCLEKVRAAMTSQGWSGFSSHGEGLFGYWLCRYFMNRFGSVVFRNTYPKREACEVSAGGARLSVPGSRGDRESGAVWVHSTASWRTPPSATSLGTGTPTTRTPHAPGDRVAPRGLSAFPERLPLLLPPLVLPGAERHGPPLSDFIPSSLRPYRAVLSLNVPSAFWPHVADVCLVLTWKMWSPIAGSLRSFTG